jgi:hypothetical protein
VLLLLQVRQRLQRVYQLWQAMLLGLAQHLLPAMEQQQQLQLHKQQQQELGRCRVRHLQQRQLLPTLMDCQVLELLQQQQRQPTSHLLLCLYEMQQPRLAAWWHAYVPPSS